ncbi:MAG TPA: glycogen/starch synthase, partial [Chitinophagaceae bacterium]|nr:glycogen/starch synthase [Chitinophagaceae bacterium]
DDKDNFFEDNSERMIFFCKSALETVKKFGWPPHVIHCHGWMTSLIPMFLKTSYKKEPVFAHSKSIYTAQKEQFPEVLGPDFLKMIMNSAALKDKDLEPYNKSNNEALIYGACKYADTIIYGEEGVNKEIVSEFKSGKGKKVVPYNPDWMENIDSLFELYQSMSQD